MNIGTLHERSFLLMERVSPHFSRIAHKYQDLRTTDTEPVLFIKERLENLNNIEGADVGCGVGRYVIKLFHHLRERLYLTCVDDNRRMLTELIKNLKRRRIRKFNTVNALAKALPMAGNSLDAIVTFNAVHHFNLPDFLEEAARVLRDDGHLFIYTRLRSQNKRNIWGRFFPEFHEKETRLYDLNELENMIKKVSMLQLESTEYFQYKRKAPLQWLITQATHHHYSTFYLYNEREFQEALQKFQENITHHFKDLDNIMWDDENTMFYTRKNI
jgi:ubiquinone/menaquinone biosynthesis C-methylase UbiE